MAGIVYLKTNRFEVKLEGITFKRKEFESLCNMDFLFPGGKVWVRPPIVGLDVMRHPRDPLSLLMLLCFGIGCVILRLRVGEPLPTAIHNFLSDKRIQFVGFGIPEKKDLFPFEEFGLTKSKVDVGYLAAKVLKDSKFKNWELADLARKVLGIKRMVGMTEASSFERHEQLKCAICQLFITSVIAMGLSTKEKKTVDDLMAGLLPSPINIEKIKGEDYPIGLFPSPTKEKKKVEDPIGFSSIKEKKRVEDPIRFFPSPTKEKKKVEDPIGFSSIKEKKRVEDPIRLFPSPTKEKKKVEDPIGFSSIKEKKRVEDPIRLFPSPTKEKKKVEDSIGFSSIKEKNGVEDAIGFSSTKEKKKLYNAKGLWSRKEKKKDEDSMGVLSTNKEKIKVEDISHKKGSFLKNLSGLHVFAEGCFKLPLVKKKKNKKTLGKGGIHVGVEEMGGVYGDVSLGSNLLKANMQDLEHHLSKDDLSLKELDKNIVKEDPSGNNYSFGEFEKGASKEEDYKFGEYEHDNMSHAQIKEDLTKNNLFFDDENKDEPKKPIRGILKCPSTNNNLQRCNSSPNMPSTPPSSPKDQVPAAGNNQLKRANSKGCNVTFKCE